VNAIARPQTHADAAAAGLRDALAAANAPLRDGVSAYRAAYAGLSASTDLLEVMRAAGSLVLAAESIVEASKQVEATARSALAQTLMDTGACSIRTGSHIFSASPGRQSVVITDPSIVPEDLLYQPPPCPNKAAILRRIKAGEQVPGCALSNGTQPILSVRAIP
jgi:hypothetical protein